MKNTIFSCLAILLVALLNVFYFPQGKTVENAPQKLTAEKLVRNAYVKNTYRVICSPMMVADCKSEIRASLEKVYGQKVSDADFEQIISRVEFKIVENKPLHPGSTDHQGSSGFFPRNPF